MLTFKEFLKEDGEFIGTAEPGKRIWLTHHAQVQMKDKDRRVSYRTVKDVANLAAEHLRNNNYYSGEHEGGFLFHSKKLNQAIVIHHAPPTHLAAQGDLTKHLVVATVFPPGDKHANPNTKFIQLEGYSDLMYIELD